MDSHEQREVTKDSEEEELYESDSEEGTSALGLRRRAGSDDEEDGHRRTSYYNEDVVENQGEPPREEDDDDKDDDEEGEDQYAHHNDVEINEVVFSEREELLKLHREDTGVLEGKESNKDRGEEEKKDAEPFVVPTAGAFYMHDDRFRADGVTRTRRSAGGRKLWEAKDEKPWLHDRFEELKLREDNYYGQDARGRRGRGRQGRVQGKGRASMHARDRGSKEQMTEDTTPQFISRNGHGKGRGLRRAKMDDYEFKESRSGNRVLPSSSCENLTIATTLKPPALQHISKSQESASKKPTTSSILNSASPPFFPTGAKSHNLDGVLSRSNKGAGDKVFEKDATPISKVASTSNIGMEKGIAPGPLRSSSNPGDLTNLGLTSNTEAQSHSDVDRNAARAPSTMQQQLIITGPRPMVHQDRSVSTKHLIEQAQVSSAPQPNRGSAPPTRSTHVQHGLQQLQRISQVQVSQGQAEPEQTQQSALRSIISVADVKTAPGSVINKSGAGGGTLATTVQAGRGTLVYGGSSLTNGLRNGIQFPGQPQPGLGVQMALPGYSNQTQFGFQNSEVTWIPILAGGSVGSNYSSPYISVDGSSAGVYYTAQASQSSSFSIRGEPAGAKTGPSASFKPPARTEPEDLGQQRKRYSQMTFSEERS